MKRKKKYFGPVRHSSERRVSGDGGGGGLIHACEGGRVHPHHRGVLYYFKHAAVPYYGGCRQAGPNSATRRTRRRAPPCAAADAQKEKTIVRGHTCFKFEKSHGAPVPNATENQMRGKESCSARVRERKKNRPQKRRRVPSEWRRFAFFFN